MFAGKLAYLNRKHLERKSATPDGLVQVVERLHQSLVDAHPTRLETLQDRTFLQRIFFLLQVSLQRALSDDSRLSNSCHRTALTKSPIMRACRK